MASLRNLDYQIGRSSWYADFLDPLSFLECFVSDNGNNRTGWRDVGYDLAVKQALAVRDTDSRITHYGSAEKILMEQQPILPLFHYVRTILLHPDVRGWQPNLLAHVPYKHLWLEADSAQ
jgi:oligopeptide transport system substrate-binding protein